MLAVLWAVGVAEPVVGVGMWGHSLVAGWMFLVVGTVCERAGNRGVRDVGAAGAASGLGALLLGLVLANGA